MEVERGYILNSEETMGIETKHRVSDEGNNNPPKMGFMCYS